MGVQFTPKEKSRGPVFVSSPLRFLFYQVGCMLLHTTGFESQDIKKEKHLPLQVLQVSLPQMAVLQVVPAAAARPLRNAVFGTRLWEDCR